MLAWLGPAIGAASYEVGDEVRDAFRRKVAARGARVCGDASGIIGCAIYTRWFGNGCSPSASTRCYGGDFDTFRDARFYSYRRDGARSGRFASLIWLDPR